MAYYRKNKNELLVLTGAVYSFVAYLTAFTLEVLFIIDLAKRNQLELLPSTSTSINQFASTGSGSLNNYDAAAIASASTFEQAKMALESMQTHVTISCLAVSILYFITFIVSLLLITALILRSTFFLLIWTCAMITLYLPEFGLILFQSIYGWGIDTRNGQTELLFYLLRAALNVIFIFRTHKLFKDWNYEKNFFTLKSNSRFTGYDSPYFIGDSLTTTINPVFSSSTLNLNRYDHIRGNFNSSPAETISNNVSPEFHYQQPTNTTGRGRRFSAYSQRTLDDDNNKFISNYHRANRLSDNNDTNRKGFYIGSNNRPDNFSREQQPTPRKIGRAQMRQNSMLSINDNDDFADYEMDLDYRTLTHQRSNMNPDARQQLQVAQTYHEVTNNHPLGLQRSPGLSYSTQSLDRRHLRDMDFSLPEQVILRPLGHQPFDYLQRPGSSSNLSSVNNLNTHPTTYSSRSKLAKGQDYIQGYT